MLTEHDVRAMCECIRKSRDVSEFIAEHNDRRREDGVNTLFLDEDWEEVLPATPRLDADDLYGFDVINVDPMDPFNSPPIFRRREME